MEGDKATQKGSSFTRAPYRHLTIVARRRRCTGFVWIEGWPAVWPVGRGDREAEAPGGAKIGNARWSQERHAAEPSSAAARPGGEASADGEANGGLAMVFAGGGCRSVGQKEGRGEDEKERRGENG